MNKLIYVCLIVVAPILQGCGGNAFYKVGKHTSFCTAEKQNTCSWMNDLLKAHPNKNIALVNICLPGSHDAAMYVTQHCTAFANTGNTQTQYLPMKEQLEAGLRLFDIRPSYYKHEFYTEHSTHCDGLGCKGDLLKNMLSATKNFLNNHNELVIINLSHFCNTFGNDTALLNLVTNILGNRMYTETEVNNLPLIQTPLQQIIPVDSKQGKAIVLIEDIDNTAANRAKGFFDRNIFKTTGGWTNDNMFPLLKEHQLRNLSAYTGNGTALFELAWQVTQHDMQAFRSALAPHARVSIVNGAHTANLALPVMLDSLILCGTIHKDKIPNIIWSDFADTMVVHQCMRLSALNAQ